MRLPRLLDLRDFQVAERRKTEPLCILQFLDKGIEKGKTQQNKACEALKTLETQSTIRVDLGQQALTKSPKPL